MIYGDTKSQGISSHGSVIVLREYSGFITRRVEIIVTFSRGHYVNTLKLRHNGRYFPDDIFKCIFLNKNVWISIKIPLKFVSKVSINNIPALVQTMAWRWPGDKPLFEPMMFSLLTHIYITQFNELIHCDIVMPYGATDLGQHLFRQWLVGSCQILNFHQ